MDTKLTTQHPPLMAEGKLAKLGARLDQLIARSVETRDRVSHKLTDVKNTSGEAIEELKFGMEMAWEDVNLAFAELKEAMEKAAQKFEQGGTDK